jgi:uncharacterized protein YbaR (Trm112 family)
MVAETPAEPRSPIFSDARFLAKGGPELARQNIHRKQSAKFPPAPREAGLATAVPQAHARAMIDATLLTLLRCPLTQQPLRVAPPEVLALLPGLPEAALLRADGTVAYPIREGIPLLLPEEAVEVVGSRKSEVGSQKSEEADRNAEVGGERAEGGGDARSSLASDL